MSRPQASQTGTQGLGTSPAPVPARSPMSPPPPPPPPPPAAPAPVWKAPDQPVSDPGAGNFFAPATAPTPSFERTFEQAGETKKDNTKTVGVVVGVVAAIVSAFLVNTFLFGDSDPLVYTGADGEVTTTDPETFFRPVAGYRFRDIPSGGLEQARAILDSEPELKGAVNAIAAKGVTQGGQVVGAIMVVGMDPSIVEDKDMMTGAMKELETAANGEVERMEFDGKIAYSAGMLGGTMTLTFYENLVIMFVAPDAETGKAIAGELLEAAP